MQRARTSSASPRWSRGRAIWRASTRYSVRNPLTLKSATTDLLLKSVTQVRCRSSLPSQIEHTPEIAPILADVVLEATAKPKTSPAPIVLKKPVKLRRLCDQEITDQDYITVCEGEDAGRDTHQTSRQQRRLSPGQWQEGEEGGSGGRRGGRR